MSKLSGDEILKSQWSSFIKAVEPHRAALFRYCLGLTGNPFDAEDLVSDAVIKMFSSRAYVTGGIRSYEAFLIRTASRTWIDHQRRHKQPHSDDSQTAEDAENLAVLADATKVLYGNYSSVQRAVIILRQVFELSHAEIGKVLAISPEVSRVTLHRIKSIDIELVERPARVSKALTARFVEAFLSHDVERIKSLLLDDMESIVFPMGHDIQAKDDFSWLRVALENPPTDLRVSEVLGDVAVLVFRDGKAKEGAALDEVWLLEESAGSISRILGYGLSISPDLVGWVAKHAE